MATDAEVTSAISAQFVAGKNKIINGDFGIWQRGTSFSNVSGYTADRWQFSWGGTSTSNITRQDLPIGSIPGGNESLYFARYTRTTTVGDDYFLQRVEDVRTLLGKTVTFSFWAKANVATTISQVYGATSYGSGGSSGSGFGNFSGIAIGTTWARYSFTGTVESGVGKTIGANSFTELVFKFATAMGNIVVDIWGVQLEVGSTATNFTTATGTTQGELAACQRYYFRNTSISTTSGFMWLGIIANYFSSTRIDGYINFPVRMRTIPSSIDISNIGWIRAWGLGVSTITSATINTTGTSDFGAILQFTTTGAVTTDPHLAYYILSNNSAGYVGLSAEL
jgi:hypothetical protein